MNETITPPLYPTLGAVLADWGRRTPDATAMICEGRVSSYARLDERTNRLANLLIASNLGDQAVVGILARNSDTYIEVVFGAAKADTVLLVLNWRLAGPELEVIVSDAGLQALFVESEFAAVADVLAATRPGLRVIPIGSGAAPSPEYEALVQSYPADAPITRVSPQSVGQLLYTSGTTGKPKGVPATHFAMLHAQSHLPFAGPRAACSPEDVNLLSTPLFHVAGLAFTFSSLMFGGALVVLPDPKLSEMIGAVETYGVTRAVFLPPVMPAVLSAAAAGARLPTLRTILYGAAAIPDSLLAKMLNTFNCAFVQNYGMTEVSGGVTYLTPDDHEVGSPRLASCGRPHPDAQLRIEGPEGKPLGVGEVGEVMIRAPSVLTEYWKRPDATAEAFRNGWYASGDMGYLDADGYLYLCDRKKDMIISGGENVYSAEVEAALVEHPDVEQVAVVGAPSDKWGEEVRAVVIRRPGSELSAGDLIAFARGRIAGYKTPRSVEFVEVLPLTSVGKVNKSELRDKYWEGHTRRIN